MNTRSRENFLIQVMNSGFERAAASFSRLVNRSVKIINGQSVLIRQEQDFSSISEEQGDLHILVTQIIGDISGKSFLIFNRDESVEVFKTLSHSVKSDTLNEAFLLELDNIISASVISELSDSLDLEIYGDVPQLVKINAKDLQLFMTKDEKKDDPASVVFCNTTFQFDKHEGVHPQFIWKLSSKIFELIPEQKITA
ncbi:MAG: hypothetical protein DI538_09450 [Azospira oryzae]|jgi:chemotaxis protein CheY-P-specific phosphatase CheC|nr:MAG: hypothetical protein DI538_09450 [Azospira oryzae]